MSATIIFPASNVCEIATAMQPATTFSSSGCFPQKFIVSFEEVKVGQRVFELNRPLELLLARVEGGWSCEEPIFSLTEWSERDVDAVCSIFQDFSFLWDEIAQVSDDVLSEEAQRTKLELLAFVKSVKVS
jgi:hypothetical protein